MQYHKLMFLAVMFVLWGQAIADEVHYKGDLNGDGKVSLYDMVQLASAINHNDSYNYHNDLINDSIVDSKDLKELARLILTETLLPETGLSGGIDDWGDGNDYEGELSAARNSSGNSPFLQSQSTSISASELTFDETVGKYYFDVSLNLSNLFSAALFDLKIKGLSLDKNQNDCPNIVVGGSSSLLSESHLIYGDPIIKNDGKTVRFIVFDEQLHSFGSLSGTIVRIYFDQIQSDEMQVEFHQTELIGYSDSDRSISADYVNECSQPVSKRKYLLVYKVDGDVYAQDSLAYGDSIIVLEAPIKEGYTFSGWSEITETMPAHDVIVTGTFKFNPAAAVNPVVEDNSEITDQNAEDITEFKMNLMSGATFAVNDGAKVELWIGGVLKGTAEKKDISEKDGIVTVKFSPVSATAGARGMLGEFWNTVATSSSEDVDIQVKIAANSFKINNDPSFAIFCTIYSINGVINR